MISAAPRSTIFLLLPPKIYFYEKHNFGVKIQKKIDEKVEDIHTLLLLGHAWKFRYFKIYFIRFIHALILAQKFTQVDLQVFQVFIKAQFTQQVLWWILKLFDAHGQQKVI